MRRSFWALGLVLAIVLAGCSSKVSDDKDRDGIFDVQEVGGWTITIHTMGGNSQRDVSSDPSKKDTDGDGVPDAYELGIGTDPRDPDTDADGLTDCQEAFHTVLEDCQDAGWSGTSDGGYPTSAIHADSDPGIGRYVNLFSDYEDRANRYLPGEVPWGDGISDGQEVLGFNIGTLDAPVMVTTDPQKHDTDGDQLEDGEEVLLYGSHPRNPNTDGDNCRDGLDPLPTFAELYDIGFDYVRLASNQTAGDVTLIVNIADDLGAYGRLAAQPGQEVRFPDGHQSLRENASCAFPPGRPYIPIEVLVIREGYGLLDFTSATNPDGAFRIYWNVVADTFAWQSGANQSIVAPITWSGNDGELRFSPLLVQAA